MNIRPIHLLLLFIIGISAGCANITAPTGGKRDKIPPKLVSITPADSQLNTRIKRIELGFDEYITVGDVSKEVQISPMPSVDPVVTGLNKHVVVKIVDSLLDSNTTYRLSFGNSIKDLHEGNPFARYTYTFSTGAYFDSLELRGSVINAATGLPDTGAISVVLYSAAEKDSAVIRHKPKYVTHADRNGSFVFKGLPHRRYRIYALKDANNNLIYDGPAAGDMIGFVDRTIAPGDTGVAPIDLRLFSEALDSTAKKALDSANKKPAFGKAKKVNADGALTYAVNIDTSNVAKRTFNINNPISISFNKAPIINKEKIRLSYDSSGITITPDIDITIDTNHLMHVTTAWSENMVYTLRLAKGFAKDTSGADVMPSRFTFRTFEDDDYGKITVNLPGKYYGAPYVLQVLTTDKDTVYQKPVTDTVVNLTRLKPAKYIFSIIVDKNGNGKWDTGDLFAKLQPEVVIPYKEVLNVRANWENIVDFEQKPQDKKTRMNDLKDKK